MNQLMISQIVQKEVANDFFKAASYDLNKNGSAGHVVQFYRVVPRRRWNFNRNVSKKVYIQVMYSDFLLKTHPHPGIKIYC